MRRFRVLRSTALEATFFDTTTAHFDGLEDVLNRAEKCWEFTALPDVMRECISARESRVFF